MSPFDNLPREIISEIFKFSIAKDVRKIDLALVCHRWNDIISYEYSHSLYGKMLRFEYRQAENVFEKTIAELNSLSRKALAPDSCSKFIYLSTIVSMILAISSLYGVYLEWDTTQEHFSFWSNAYEITREVNCKTVNFENRAYDVTITDNPDPDRRCILSVSDEFKTRHNQFYNESFNTLQFKYNLPIYTILISFFTLPILLFTHWRDYRNMIQPSLIRDLTDTLSSLKTEHSVKDLRLRREKNNIMTNRQFRELTKNDIQDYANLKNDLRNFISSLRGSDERTLPAPENPRLKNFLQTQLSIWNKHNQNEKDDIMHSFSDEASATATARPRLP